MLKTTFGLKKIFAFEYIKDKHTDPLSSREISTMLIALKKNLKILIKTMNMWFNPAYDTDPFVK